MQVGLQVWHVDPEKPGRQLQRLQVLSMLPPLSHFFAQPGAMSQRSPEYVPPVGVWAADVQSHCAFPLTTRQIPPFKQAGALVQGVISQLSPL